MNRNEPWHIYLSPFCPEFFPVLAIAKYVLMYPNLIKGDICFFTGYSQYIFLMHIFSYVLKEYKDYFVALNVDVSSLAYQISCKGTTALYASC